MGSETATLALRFDGIPLSEANVLARELEMEVRAASDGVKVNVVKDDKNTQDFGATLILVLGTPAIVAVAKAIGDYIQRRGVTVTITPEGGVAISNVKSGDVASIVKNLPKNG